MKRVTEPLAEHTTLKIGGPAEIAVPETRDELVDLLRECESNGRPYRTLGNGSNLLVSDAGVDELVIKTTEACTETGFEGSRVRVGASVLLPQFVSECITHDLGGYEYLYSVPGTVGGALYMNAGRGASHGETIKDFLVSVEFLSEGSVHEVPVEDLEFAHRHSSFQEMDGVVILAATFDLPAQPSDEGREKVRERMRNVENKERSKPNAGSVFKSGSRFPLQLVPPDGLSVGDARFVEQNRICNDGNATYRDVARLIRYGSLLNRLIPPFSPPEVEWEIWK